MKVFKIDRYDDAEPIKEVDLDAIYYANRQGAEAALAGMLDGMIADMERDIENKQAALGKLKAKKVKP